MEHDPAGGYLKKVGHELDLALGVGLATALGSDLTSARAFEQGTGRSTTEQRCSGSAHPGYDRSIAVDLFIDLRLREAT